MPTPSMRSPPEMRDFAEKSVDQARKAFESFIGAARRRWVRPTRQPPACRPARAPLATRRSLREQNVRSAFDYASRVVKVTDMQELMQLQSEYVKSQMANAAEQAKDFGSTFQSTVSSSFKKPEQG